MKTLKKKILEQDKLIDFLKSRIEFLEWEMKSNRNIYPQPQIPINPNIGYPSEFKTVFC